MPVQFIRSNQIRHQV